MLRGIPFHSIYGTSSSTLCRRCLLQSLAARQRQARYLSQNWVKRQDDAALDWDKKGELIKNGELPHLWDTLKERGYIRELMRRKRIGAYVGIDPTAASLHIGHLLPLMPLFWMYINGFRAVSLIGGSTAKIGDPSGRLKNRDPMTHAEMGRNITKAHYQLKRLWVNLETQAKRYGYEKENMVWSRALYNNSIWYNSLNFMDIIWRLFRGVRLSNLLSRETVKNKMEKGDGMSLDELIYPLLQAWDWWMLYKRLGVRMQIGGSDQFGNIVSGVEAVKYIRDSEPNETEKFPNDLFHTPVGFTTPLLTDSSGAKYGKSAGNAIWLDPYMTSPFDLYGYFMRRPDADVERLLKLFTFIPLEEISKIVEEHMEDPAKRQAQHVLAFEVVALVHSLEEAKNTQNRHKGLFSKGDTEVTTFPSNDIPASNSMAAAFQVDIKLPESLILGKSIARILFAAGLSDSITDASRLTQQQGAYIGGAPGQPAATNPGMSFGDLAFTPVKAWFPQETRNFLIGKKVLILRRGKHFIRVIEMVSDEEWAESGLMYPGEPGTGRIRQLREVLSKAAENEGLDMNKPGVMEKLLDDAQDLYKDKTTKWRDMKLEQVGRQVEDNRARQILKQSFRRINWVGPTSVRCKTNAIDDVILKTRLELEKELKDASRHDFEKDDYEAEEDNDVDVKPPLPKVQKVRVG
ncbi:tRNA synthetases class I-domain-containing protein [Annulohypoxylon bovei var. microspora]|nr:tRNA synthetases class I-domain-containing protein [Annulohypoxylon bovei var. microspora]